MKILERMVFGISSISFIFILWSIDFLINSNPNWLNGVACLFIAIISNLLVYIKIKKCNKKNYFKGNLVDLNGKILIFFIILGILFFPRVITFPEFIFSFVVFFIFMIWNSKFNFYLNPFFSFFGKVYFDKNNKELLIIGS